MSFKVKRSKIIRGSTMAQVKPIFLDFGTYEVESNNYFDNLSLRNFLDVEEKEPADMTESPLGGRRSGIN